MKNREIRVAPQNANRGYTLHQAGTITRLTHEKPMQPIPSERISAQIAGYELAVAKYAKKCGLCQ